MEESVSTNVEKPATPALVLLENYAEIWPCATFVGSGINLVIEPLANACTSVYQVGSIRALHQLFPNFSATSNFFFFRPRWKLAL
jgi:hypothetical protein